MYSSLQFDAWRTWWRSRSPEEREGGLAPHLYKITQISLIEVPVPFCGHIEVFVFSLGRTKRRSVKVSKRTIGLLRDLFLCPNRKKWTVKKKETCVQFWRGGVLLDRTGVPVAGGF